MADHLDHHALLVPGVQHMVERRERRWKMGVDHTTTNGNDRALMG
jgi:hypothetical protein